MWRTKVFTCQHRLYFFWLYCFILFWRHTQLYSGVTSCSTLRDHSWQDPGSIGDLGVKPGSAAARQVPYKLYYHSSPIHSKFPPLMSSCSMGLFTSQKSCRNQHTKSVPTLVGETRFICPTKQTSQNAILKGLLQLPVWSSGLVMTPDVYLPYLCKINREEVTFRIQNAFWAGAINSTKDSVFALHLADQVVL